MKATSSRCLFVLIALAVLPGCLATQTGSLEVLNPKQAYGQSLVIISDLHRENEAIENRLASDLQAALAKRGLTIAGDPAKADIVVVPTLGRMRERSPAPAEPVATDLYVPADGGVPIAAVEPVVAAPASAARPFNRFSSGNTLTSTGLANRRDVPSARPAAGAQQAGLLLTAYRAEDYRDYGTGRQSLPPVWRVYVSQPATQMKWNSVAVPLINAAAVAARPLGKGGEVRNAEVKVKKEEAAAEQPQSRAAGNGSREKKEDRKIKGREDEETKKRPKAFPWFGNSERRGEAATGEVIRETTDRR